MAYVSLRYIALIVLSAQMPIASAAPHLRPVDQLGRTFGQSIVMGDTHFTACASISNPDYGGFYLTSDLQDQISFDITDINGITVHRRHPGMPPPPPPPPPSEEISSYFILQGHSRLETCRDFSYNEFDQGQFRIQARFQSWLTRDAAIPEPVRRMSLDNPYIGRPLYRDEPLISEICEVDISARSSRCAVELR